MYKRIESEIQRVQQALQSSHVVSTVPLPKGTTEEGDEPVQLRKIVSTVKACLQKAQEEIIEQLQAVQQEKYALQAKFEEDIAKI
jgi:hypothetical protein